MVSKLVLGEIMLEIPIAPKGRWEVVFKDNGRWQCGVYVPENTSLDDVEYLEKHNVPELFYLVKGSIVLVLSSNGRDLREVPMKPGVIYIIDEWHNAYRPKGSEGIALVIEGVTVETKYLKIKTKTR